MLIGSNCRFNTPLSKCKIKTHCGQFNYVERVWHPDIMISHFVWYAELRNQIWTSERTKPQVST